MYIKSYRSTKLTKIVVVCFIIIKNCRICFFVVVGVGVFSCLIFVQKKKVFGKRGFFF